MIKFLLAWAIIFSGAAHAAFGFSSAPLMAGGSTYACDVGSPYTGKIPDGAARAGYTHCLANLEFTNTASFTDQVGTHSWGTLSDWFDCFGAGSKSILFNTGPNNVACDSSHYAMVTDNGKQTFQMTVTAADVNSNSKFIANPTSLDPTQPNFPDYNGHGWTLPVGYYVDYVMRMDRTDNCSGGSCTAGSPFSYTFGSPSTGFFECDYGESYSTPTSVPMNTQYCGEGSGVLGPMPTVTPADQTNYHDYGYRATTDGSTQVETCNYYDGSFLSCTNQGSFTPTTGTFTSRVNFLMMYGCFASCTSPLGGGKVWQTTNYEIQRFTFWTCPAGVDTAKTDIQQSSAQCNGGLISNSP